MTTAPDIEEEAEPTEEEIEAHLESTLIDAEVFLRTTRDLLDELALAGRIPKKMVDQIEKLHEELVDAMPED